VAFGTTRFAPARIRDREVTVMKPTAGLAQRESRRSSNDEAEWIATDRICMIGAWSARAILVLVAAYVVVFVVGFAYVGNLNKPLPDPYLAIAEVLILLMAPIMVTLMLAMHDCAPARAKPCTQIAHG